MAADPAAIGESTILAVGGLQAANRELQMAAAQPVPGESSLVPRGVCMRAESVQLMAVPPTGIQSDAKVQELEMQLAHERTQAGEYVQQMQLEYHQHLVASEHRASST